MSEFTHHESCPNCGSRDNLACYDDGHKWCFGCRYYEPPILSVDRLRARGIDTLSDKKQVRLPEDFDLYVPEKGQQWLDKYRLTNQEIRENRFGWSNEGVIIKKTGEIVKPLLVFPIYSVAGELLMWQGRNFGETGQKYLIFGNKDILHILGNQEDRSRIILTEDLISAIKVSRYVPSLPLFGASLNLDMARRLAGMFESARFWLDHDKATEAVKQAQAMSYLFKEGITTIRTLYDPKEYSNEQLKEYLK